MLDKIDKAIVALTSKINSGVREDQALKFSQAALNLANAKSTLVQIETISKPPEPKKGGQA